MSPDSIEIRVVESYTAADRLSLSGGDSDPSQTASLSLKWQPKTLHVNVVESGIIVSHVGLLTCTVTVGDHLVRVAGIGGMLTRQDCRGKGFGQLAMQKAEEFARRHMDVNFGLLFLQGCGPALV